MIQNRRNDSKQREHPKCAKTPSPYKGGARNTKPAYPSGTSSTNAGYQTFSKRRQALLV
ncbi:hypothetical protein NIES22_17440 [Calothrix brevissima NIES-22]|nr:hypothetical protein NIES22_17440 [Calothrix brevissima NIES-22]